MAFDRKGGGRPNRRAFQPTLDGRLEPRVLLARTSIRAQLAAGGQAVVVTTPIGQQYFVSVVNGGSVQAFPASGGRVNLVVNGSTQDTLLEINTIALDKPKGQAHRFNTALSKQNRMLNVASVTVTSGTIGAIEGYRNSILSGPISVPGTNPVNRIAFASVAPGAAIGVGGDLNTLDILNDANFSNGAGIFVGRDLNSFSVGGNLSFSNGANLFVGRDVGLVLQVAKGTGPAGFGIAVAGNFSVANNSGFAIARKLDGTIVVNGNYSGATRTLIGGLPLPTYILVNSTLGIFNVNVQGTFT